MIKVKSLVDGIGNQLITEKYYDNWALNYDHTLKNWNYKAPIKAVNKNKRQNKFKFRFSMRYRYVCQRA